MTNCNPSYQHHNHQHAHLHHHHHNHNHHQHQHNHQHHNLRFRHHNHQHSQHPHQHQNHPHHHQYHHRTSSSFDQLESTEVLVIGNGPSGIVLSFLLSGRWPYYAPTLVDDTSTPSTTTTTTMTTAIKEPQQQVQPHPIDFLHQRLLQQPPFTSVLEMDLHHLSCGLTGRTLNRISTLFDQLQNPNTDFGHQQSSTIRWYHHRDRSINHLVLGTGLPGGLWHSLRRSKTILTVSQQKWMQLPELPILDVDNDGNDDDGDGGVAHNTTTITRRISFKSIAKYYRNYVSHYQLDSNFRNHTKVIRVEWSDTLKRWIVDAIASKRCYYCCCAKVDDEDGEVVDHDHDHNDHHGDENDNVDDQDDHDVNDIDCCCCVQPRNIRIRYIAEKVVLATGANSCTPSLLNIPGERTSGSVVIHSLDQLESILASTQKKQQQQKLSQQQQQQLKLQQPQPQLQQQTQQLQCRQMTMIPNVFACLMKKKQKNCSIRRLLFNNNNNDNNDNNNNNDHHRQHYHHQSNIMKHHLPLAKVNKPNPTTKKTIILLVGSGLSAADALIMLQNVQSTSLSPSSSYYVIHIFRRAITDRALIFNQLSNENLYPEYACIYRRMQQSVRKAKCLHCFLNDGNDKADADANDDDDSMEINIEDQKESSSTSTFNYQAYHRCALRSVNRLNSDNDDDDGDADGDGNYHQANVEFLPEHSSTTNADHHQHQQQCHQCHQSLSRQTTLPVSVVLILIGSKPKLDFLPAELLHRLTSTPNTPIDIRHNPIRINTLTHETAAAKGLYAIGPLVGDNFVRYLQGGALAVVADLWRQRRCQRNEQQQQSSSSTTTTFSPLTSSTMISINGSN